MRFIQLAAPSVNKSSIPSLLKNNPCICLSVTKEIALNAPWMNDVNDGYMATDQGTTEKVFGVPGRRRIHDLHKAG